MHKQFVGAYRLPTHRFSDHKKNSVIPSYLKIEILAKRSYLVTLGNKKLIFLSKKSKRNMGTKLRGFREKIFFRYLQHEEYIFFYILAAVR